MKLSELKPSQNKKICVLGDSGSGKTVFAAGCPGPIYFFDFDGKISSAASYFAKDPERLTQIHYDSYQPADEKDHPFARYDKKLTELAQAKPFPYATVVVDSLTTYADAMFKEIVRQNPGIQRSKTNLAIGSSVQDYGIFAQYFKHMLTRLLQLPANVIVTGHIVTDKDELTGEIIREPFLPGRQAPKMVPILFEEVYRAFAEIKDGRVAYRAQTQSDGRYKCRSQIRGIPPVIDLSYATLEKFMSA